MRKIIGLNFDGVVVRRTEVLNVMDMFEVPGLRNTLRQSAHKKYDLVSVSSRGGPLLSVAEQFIAQNKLGLRIFNFGLISRTGNQLNTNTLLVYVSDRVSDLTSVMGKIPNLILYDDYNSTQKAIPLGIKRASSHHQLMLIVDTCLRVKLH
jgi:hypothetical protein